MQLRITRAEATTRTETIDHGQVAGDIASTVWKL
jgi:hypothetical protein